MSEKISLDSSDRKIEAVSTKKDCFCFISKTNQKTNMLNY